MEKCRRMKSPQCMSRNLDIFLTMKVLENTPAVLSLGKLCDEHGYSYEWITGQKPPLITNGIRIQCNTENSIVVPGLSTSSSSGSHPLTSMTPSRQERRCSTSSSSSSSSQLQQHQEKVDKVNLIPFQCLCQVNMLNE